MIKFFVQNKEVILPADFSFTMVENNPEINNEGEFTLDMKVSLKCTQNIIAFKFLNRTNKQDIEQKTDAYMSEDGQLFLGTIRITDNTNSEVTFQFLSGNSELNYLIKNKKKIYELEGWGTESAIDFNRAVLSLQQTGYIWEITVGANLVRNSKLISNNYLPTWDTIYRSVSLESGKTYTLSITGRSTETGFTGKLDVGIKNSNNTVTVLPVNTYSFADAAHATTVTVTFTSNVTDANCNISLVRYSLDPGHISLISIKVEEGSVATAWCHNVQDICTFVCAPIKVSDDIVNDFEFNIATSGEYFDDGFRFDRITGKTIMQPYLLYYINRLPALLDYTLKYNVLNYDLRAKLIYLVNATESLNYADALPNMTVSEFITAIENFFNVSFIVDSKDKSISINNFQSSFESKKTVNLSGVLDDYNREFTEDDTSLKFGFTKLSYDVPSSKYFDYQKLSDAIISKCEVLNFEYFEKLYTYVASHLLVDKYKIYRDLDKNEDYISCAEPSFNLFNQKIDDDRHVTLVNKFASVGSSDENELIFKIVPAQIDAINKTLYYGDPVYADYICFYQIPKSSNSYSIIEDLGLTSSIEIGLKEATRLSNLEVSLFMGLTDILAHYFTVPYPFSYSDLNPEFGKDAALTYTEFERWRFDKYIPNALTTLKLIGDKGIIADYHQQSIIDMRKVYTYDLIDTPEVSARNAFMINGLKYIPISLERVKKRVKGTVKGKFYRMV